MARRALGRRRVRRRKPVCGRPRGRRHHRAALRYPRYRRRQHRAARVRLARVRRGYVSLDLEDQERTRDHRAIEIGREQRRRPQSTI